MKPPRCPIAAIRVGAAEALANRPLSRVCKPVIPTRLRRRSRSVVGIILRLLTIYRTNETISRPIDGGVVSESISLEQNAAVRPLSLSNMRKPRVAQDARRASHIERAAAVGGISFNRGGKAHKNAKFNERTDANGNSSAWPASCRGPRTHLQPWVEPALPLPTPYAHPLLTHFRNSIDQSAANGNLLA